MSVVTTGAKGVDPSGKVESAVATIGSSLPLSPSLSLLPLLLIQTRAPTLATMEITLSLSPSPPLFLFPPLLIQTGASTLATMELPLSFSLHPLGASYL